MKKVFDERMRYRIQQYEGGDEVGGSIYTAGFTFPGHRQNERLSEDGSDEVVW